MRNFFRLLAIPALTTVTLAAGITGLASTSTVASALPSTITVTTLGDAGVGSLRQAMLDAETAPGADTIDFAAGLTGTITLASDLPQITESLTITGPGRDSLTISGADLYQPLDASGVGTILTISDIAITHGLAEAGGAMIVTTSASLVLDSVLIENNTASNQFGGGNGGGLYIATDGSASISNTIVRNNSSADQAHMNGMAGGAYVYASTVAITDSDFSGNTSDVFGGVFVGSPISATITGVRISSNIATNFVGGGTVNAENLFISDVVITENHDNNDVGGATFSGAIVRANRIRVSNNSSVSGLGGLGVTAVTSTLDDLTITENSGLETGGLRINGDVSLTSSTIANNVGPGITLGGNAPTSIDSMDSIAPSGRFISADVTIAHSTIVGNSTFGIVNLPFDACVGSLSTPSAGISYCSLAVVPSVGVPNYDAQVVLDHTLVTGNGTDLGMDVKAAWSLITNTDAFAASGYFNIIGVAAEVEPLTVIDEFTSVIPIPFGSAAWNAGYPGFEAPPATDQAGQPRVIDIIDIGAYEQQTPAPLIPTFTG